MIFNFLRVWVRKKSRAAEDFVKNRQYNSDYSIESTVSQEKKLYNVYRYFHVDIVELLQEQIHKACDEYTKKLKNTQIFSNKHRTKMSKNFKNPSAIHGNSRSTTAVSIIRNKEMIKVSRHWPPLKFDNWLNDTFKVLD